MSGIGVEGGYWISARTHRRRPLPFAAAEIERPDLMIAD